MRINKQTIITFFAVIILGVPWLLNTFPESANFIDKIFLYVDNNYASVFLRKPITVNQLHDKYNITPNINSKIRVLIVPGHEPDFGGTEYKNLKERDLNVELSQYLFSFLKNDNHFDVILSRNKDSWNSDLDKYFKDNWSGIAVFLKENKDEMLRLMNSGLVTTMVGGMEHNKAPQDVAMRLFGINKWANENAVDIVIHVHFNDYPRRNVYSEGEYSGLSIYVPEKQYSNSTTTKVIADSVFKRLSKYNAISNLPKEESGINEDQELIAIGSYNTLNAPSMLIEYGYIYESRFADKEVRDVLLKDLAFQTYLGILDFFGNSGNISIAYDTLMLPYNWKSEFDKTNAEKSDVLALQTALLLEGLYPANGRSKNDCPITGKFGQCTKEALDNFQKKYEIKGEKGIVGEKTKSTLNGGYSLKLK